MSADLSTAYVWPQTFDLDSNLLTNFSICPQSCPVQMNDPDSELTTFITQHLTCPSVQKQWMRADDEDVSFFGDKLALTEACYILPWILFTELSWKDLGSSHTAIKQPLAQLKQS